MNHQAFGANAATQGWSLGRGLLLGLAFILPGILVFKYQDEFERLRGGMNELPVINTLSRDFRTGLEAAGKIFLEHSLEFYAEQIKTIDPNLPFGEDPFLRKRSGEAPFGWNRREIEEKLAREFGPRKLKSAQNFLDYVEHYQYLAASEMAISHIPASIKLAQGILETDAGQGFLAQVANNHFGIKCMKYRDYKKDGYIDDGDFYHHSLAFDCEQRADDNVWDRFEKYRSPEISYRRHTLLLTESSRYNWMPDRYRTGEHYRIPRKWFGTELVPYYAAWAAGLKESGYATSPRYAQKLAYIIETYELWRIDYGVVLSE